MRPGTLSKSLAAIVLLFAASAAAAEYKHVASHVTKKDPEHVLTVLTSYAEMCAEGCRYRAPNVKKIEKLAHGKTEAAWYTWTWVGNAVKDMKYFSRVAKTTTSDGATLLTIHLIKDEKLIAELEKASGKPHNSELESAKTRITIRPQEDGRTKIVQDMTVHAGILLSLFSGQIKDGMKDSAVANFANIEK